MSPGKSAKSPPRVRIAVPNRGKRKSSDKTKYFRIFTDGGCSGNGKSWAKAGLGVHFPKQQHPDISLPFTSQPITNQRAELAAILEALRVVLSGDLLDGYDELVIYSDSDYSIKCVTLWAPTWQKNGWKRSGYDGAPLKNLDLIRAIFSLLPKLPIPLVFVHVLAHTGGDDYRSRHNAIVDELASEGVRKSNPTGKGNKFTGGGSKKSKGNTGGGSKKSKGNTGGGSKKSKGNTGGAKQKSKRSIGRKGQGNRRRGG
jgi:ribonuclease HI